MSHLFYKPEGHWLGDVIPFYENGKYYLFFLKDARGGDVPVDRVCWDLLVTEDFVRYDHVGTAIPNGGDDEPDNSVYTGSVFKEGPGKYHIFYTAHNNHCDRYKRDGKPVQTVMHAVSADLVHWEKRPGRAFGSDGVDYEIWDWRDPFVYRDEEAGLYRMLLCARKKGGTPRRGGVVLGCWSEDLTDWHVDGPLCAPGAYLAHECPDLFRMGEWWYLVYSTFTDKFETHYRMSRSPRGPWIAPEIDTWDGRAWYAAKTAGDGQRRFAFGWVPTKAGGSDFGAYEWGGSLAVRELVQRPDGTLLAKLPDTVLAAYGPGVSPEPDRFEGRGAADGAGIGLDGREGLSLAVFDGLPEECLIECDIRFTRPVRCFGIDLNAGANLDDGYFFKLEPFHNRLILDMWPRAAQGLGGDIPYQIELERPVDLAGRDRVRLRIQVEGEIASAWVDDAAALCVRRYNLLGNRRWALFVQDGAIRVEGLRIRPRQ